MMEHQFEHFRYRCQTSHTKVPTPSFHCTTIGDHCLKQVGEVAVGKVEEVAVGKVEVGVGEDGDWSPEGEKGLVLLHREQFEMWRLLQDQCVILMDKIQPANRR
jgi:hypothetical protein